MLAHHRGQVDLAVLDREGVVVLGRQLGIALVDVDDERSRRQDADSAGTAPARAR